MTIDLGSGLPSRARVVAAHALAVAAARGAAPAARVAAALVEEQPAATPPLALTDSRELGRAEQLDRRDGDRPPGTAEVVRLLVERPLVRGSVATQTRVPDGLRVALGDLGEVALGRSVAVRVRECGAIEGFAQVQSRGVRSGSRGWIRLRRRGEPTCLAGGQGPGSNAPVEETSVVGEQLFGLGSPAPVDGVGKVEAEPSADELLAHISIVMPIEAKERVRLV
jgi:hypothetical protein